MTDHFCPIDHIAIDVVDFDTALAFFKKEFRPKGGSSPMLRFLLGVFVMIGALVFLGCPLRMVIRLGGGDLNALAVFHHADAVGGVHQGVHGAGVQPGEAAAQKLDVQGAVL